MAIQNKGRKLTDETPEASKQAVKPAGKREGGKIDLEEQGRSIYHSKSDEDKKILGSKSGDLEFVALITNPYYPVSRKQNGKLIKGEETVGAILKNVGEETITVATIPNKTYNVMDGDFENASTREVKPGEEFQVNSLEAGHLLTRDEYGSRITGGGKEITYSTQAPKDPEMLPTTKLLKKGGSIKDDSISIAETSEDGKTKTMKPDFEEKFSIFSTRANKRRSVAGTSSKPKVNPKGLAVQALFNQKLKNLSK